MNHCGMLHLAVSQLSPSAQRSVRRRPAGDCEYVSFNKPCVVKYYCFKCRLGNSCVSDEQDVTKMGDLARMVPTTYTMIGIGSLVLMGFPFETGFCLKDLIFNVSGCFTALIRFV